MLSSSFITSKENEDNENNKKVKKIKKIKTKDNKNSKKTSKIKKTKIDDSDNEVEKNIVESSLTTEKYRKCQRNKKNTQLIFRIIKTLSEQNHLQKYINSAFINLKLFFLFTIRFLFLVLTESALKYFKRY